VVEEGQQAPDFELASDSGERVRLSDFGGRPVVLFFYPRDDTPGCTKEACGFRDAYAAFAEHDAVILGVSPDTEESHVRFKEKYGLPFTLLADPEKEVAQAYGVWGERKLYGKTSMGINRSTFVIGPDGTIVKAMRGVKPAGHPEKVLSALAG
jgi:thioredoxin-dependent peroxiredoxin